MVHNGQTVSSFKPAFEPCATAFHPTEKEVVICGKVSVVILCVCCCVHSL